MIPDTSKISDYKYLDFSEEFGSMPTYDQDVPNFQPEISISEPENIDFTPQGLFGNSQGLDQESFSDFSESDFDGYDGQDLDFEDDFDGDSDVLGVQTAQPQTPEMLQNAIEEAETILADARQRAQEILDEATANAEQIQNDAIENANAVEASANEKGYAEGYENGKKAGHDEALEETRKELEEENKSLFEEIKRAVTELERQKTDYIRQYHEEMKELVIAIAEKVINISLKSSGEVIRRMIMNAVESSHDKQWAKIYISGYDANVLVREDSDILDVLRSVSDHIKVEVMENGKPGDLLIEYPDSAIDAGVSTQLDNIREMVENS